LHAGLAVGQAEGVNPFDDIVAGGGDGDGGGGDFESSESGGAWVIPMMNGLHR